MSCVKHLTLKEGSHCETHTHQLACVMRKIRCMRPVFMKVCSVATQAESMEPDRTELSATTSRTVQRKNSNIPFDWHAEGDVVDLQTSTFTLPACPPCWPYVPWNQVMAICQNRTRRNSDAQLRALSGHILRAT